MTPAIDQGALGSEEFTLGADVYIFSAQPDANAYSRLVNCTGT